MKSNIRVSNLWLWKKDKNKLLSIFCFSICILSYVEKFMLSKERLVELAKSYKLSDIHVHSDEPLALRISGSIEVPFPAEIIQRSEVQRFIDSIMDDEQKAQYLKQKDLDFAISKDDYRFRVNVYNTINGPNIVMRKIETKIPDAKTLGLPEVILSIANQKNGLVLVTGPTGSGKSTSLAAIIDKINQDRKDNILTVEDPIEFVHHSKTSIVSHREVGKDAVSFASALKAMLREDPDVILVGEMRDLETISLALTAAETGHLVFGTLHTNGAPNSINRILDVFPPAQQAQARSQLSQSLRMVVTQQLIKRADGNGRVAAFEIMVCTPAIANLIRENKIFQIEHSMQTGKSYGMITMEESVKQLMEKGIIAPKAVKHGYVE